MTRRDCRVGERQLPNRIRLASRVLHLLRSSWRSQTHSPLQLALVRERREAAAKEGRAPEELPSSFHKLPRVQFLLLLCKEIVRVNRRANPHLPACEPACCTHVLPGDTWRTHAA